MDLSEIDTQDLIEHLSGRVLNSTVLDVPHLRDALIELAEVLASELRSTT